MSTVLLVRHGESEANAGSPSSDPALIPLSMRGCGQADQVAAALDAPELIVSSPYLRAEQTAVATRRVHPRVPWETWPVQEFTYLGSLHGRTTTPDERKQIAERYWAACDPESRDDERSESFADVWQRARAFLDRLAARDEERIVVFGHGLFTRVVLWSLFTGADEPDTSAMWYFARFRDIYPIGNGAITTLRFDEQRQPQYCGTTTAHLTGE